GGLLQHELRHEHAPRGEPGSAPRERTMTRREPGGDPLAHAVYAHPPRVGGARRRLTPWRDGLLYGVTSWRRRSTRSWATTDADASRSASTGARHPAPRPSPTTSRASSSVAASRRRARRST